MSSLAIRDHSQLQSSVVRGTLAGGAYGLLHWLFPGPAAVVLGVVAIGVAAVPPKSVRSAMLAAVVAVLAGVTAALPGAWGLGAMAAVGGLTFARDLRGRGRRLVAAVAGSLGLAAGWFVERALAGSDAVSAVPIGVASLLLGSSAGFVASLGAAGRELTVREPPTLPPPPSVPALEPSTELGGLLARASAAFRDADGALGGEAPEARAAAGDLLQRIDHFGRHWHDLEREAGRTDRGQLAARLDEMKRREESASDGVVRGEYAQARAALQAQLDYLDGIERGRDRAVARLHHHVAVLERLRLAALHHRSTDETRVGDELAPLVEDLAAAGRDLDFHSEVLAELPAAG